ncbi:MAG: hypothetical protein AB8G14_06870 [Ilumatobacter sp.]
MPRALTFVVLMLIAALGLNDGSAAALPSCKQSYLFVSVFDDGVEDRVEMPVADLSAENGPYVILRFEVDETFESAPESFVAEPSVIIEANPGKDALTCCRSWPRSRPSTSRHAPHFSTTSTWPGKVS